jgi:general stress protein YciG
MGSTFLLDPGGLGGGGITRVVISGNDSNTSAQGSSEATRRRGFAAMDPERQREIAREGGRASHQHGTAHEWSSEEAAAAGRKGGQASHGRGPSGQPSGGVEPPEVIDEG